MDQFIARENVRHLRELLWSESDADRRARMMRLLLEEENKLAADMGLLADIDRHIGDGHSRIVRQRALVALMERDGDAGLDKARNLLDTLVESQQSHTRYRERVLIAIEQNRL